MPNNVALQRQRDLQTVQSLAALLAPDVAPSNAFDDLSGLSSGSGEDEIGSDRINLRHEPEDSRLPLDLSQVSRVLRSATPESMAAVYRNVKNARLLSEAEAMEASGGWQTSRGTRRAQLDDVEAFASPLPSGPLSRDQQTVFDKILRKYSRGEQLLEIVHGMPGTGKTVVDSHNDFVLFMVFSRSLRCVFVRQ